VAPSELYALQVAAFDWVNDYAQSVQ
jgi:hypothetical protein